MSCARFFLCVCILPRCASDYTTTVYNYKKGWTSSPTDPTTFYCYGWKSKAGGRALSVATPGQTNGFALCGDATIGYEAAGGDIAANAQSQQMKNAKAAKLGAYPLMDVRADVARVRSVEVQGLSDDRSPTRQSASPGTASAHYWTYVL